MQTHKRGDVSMAAAMTTTDQLPLPPSRSSASTILVRDKCPSTSAATNLPLFAVGNSGRLGGEGSGFNQPATSVVGGRDGGSLARKGIYNEYCG